MLAFEIVETAAPGEAWDVLTERGDRVRLVAQEGCGCSGIVKAYNVIDEYSGTLDKNGVVTTSM